MASMSLQFPNARLFIHDLLTRGGSPVRALSEGAHEFGLIPFDAVEEINRLDCRAGCQCMAAAHKILNKHFANKNHRSGMPKIDVKQVCQAFEREAKAFHQKSGNSEQCGQEIAGEIDCKKRAPAIFDLLLQQVRRYP